MSIMYNESRFNKWKLTYIIIIIIIGSGQIRIPTRR